MCAPVLEGAAAAPPAALVEGSTGSCGVKTYGNLAEWQPGHQAIWQSIFLAIWLSSYPAILQRAHATL